MAEPGARAGKRLSNYISNDPITTERPSLLNLARTDRNTLVNTIMETETIPVNVQAKNFPLLASVHVVVVVVIPNTEPGILLRPSPFHRLYISWLHSIVLIDNSLDFEACQFKSDLASQVEEMTPSRSIAMGKSGGRSPSECAFGPSRAFSGSTGRRRYRSGLIYSLVSP